MAKPENIETDLDSLAIKFQALLNAPYKKERPPNSITAAEYAERAGCSRKAASEFLLSVYRAGLARRYRISQSYAYVLEDYDAT